LKTADGMNEWVSRSFYSFHRRHWPVENLGARPLVSEGLTRPQREVLTIALDPPGHSRLGDLYVSLPIDNAAYLGVVEGEVAQTEDLCNTHQHLLIVVG